MIRNPVVRKNKVTTEQISKRKNRLRLFVPVDFSSSSYNTLRYAMHIANMCEGTIDLFYILRNDNFSISESPLTMQHSLRKAESDAYKKLSSIKEIINNFGVFVTSTHVAIGEPMSTLRTRISETTPDVIVLDKNKKSSQWSTFSLPCLYVPSMIVPMTPNKVLMIRDGRRIHEKSLKPLLEILNHGTNKITVVNCVKSIKKMLFKYGLPLGDSKIDFTHKFEVVHSTSEELTKVVTKYSPDLICQMEKKRTWWEKLFNLKTHQGINTDIPTLMIPV